MDEGSTVFVSCPGDQFASITTAVKLRLIAARRMQNNEHVDPHSGVFGKRLRE